MLCIIQETRNTFGTSLICKKWKDICRRKEYTFYRINANKIICLAYKNNMFCPDIILENYCLKMKFTNDGKYVIFSFNKYDEIDISIGIIINNIDEEKHNFKWTETCNMKYFSKYLFKEVV